MADRLATFEKIRRGELTKKAAAQLLGISRTRITQLMNRQDKKAKGAPPMGTSPAVVKPSPVDPLKSVFDGPTPEPPPASPGNLDDVLRPINPPAAPVPAGGGGAPPEKIAVDAVPHDQEAVNPEDAAAGRALIRWVTKFCREGMAKYVYRVPATDPRMAELREENEFLGIAMKRNSEKAAPLGALTNGWKGLIIGYTMEVIRVAFALAGSKPSSGAGATPPAPARPPAPPPNPSQAPTAPPPESKSVREVRDDIEAPARPRLTTEERIALMNQGK